jgi:hypothetical protein
VAVGVGAEGCLKAEGEAMVLRAPAAAPLRQRAAVGESLRTVRFTWEDVEDRATD